MTNVNSEPSNTALMAAAARAAHLIVDDEPVIFSDTLAADLLGDRAGELLRYHQVHGSHLVLASARTQVTCRSRFAEESLGAARERGVDQYVILGAGLDSFACRSARNDRSAQLSVFEVDHPATQEWKRERLRAAGLTSPPNARFVPVDLETDALTSRLIDGGFDGSRPALVSWLGVTMYLTEDAIEAALGELAGLAPGSELVLDYMLPASLRDDIGNSYVEQVAPAAAERGEPWLSFLTPQQVTSMLEGHGFGGIHHVAQHEIGGPAMWHRTDALRPASLSRLARARLAPSG